MAKEEPNALIRRPTTEVNGVGRRASPVIRRLTRDVLARLRAHQVSQERFSIHGLLFREPDYRQILEWSEALGVTAEEVVDRLDESWIETGYANDPGSIGFVVDDGAIVSVVWD